MAEPEEAPEYDQIVSIAVDGEIVAKVDVKSTLLMSDLEDQIASRLLYKTFEPDDDEDETDSINVEEIAEYDPEIQAKLGDDDWGEIPPSNLE